jgi:hypothetical protein
MASVDDKGQTVDHIDRDVGSQSSSAEEKGVAPVYPLNDDDYVVTAKTWVVVAIMASSYGVSVFDQSITTKSLT